MTRLGRSILVLAAAVPSLALAANWTIDPAHSNSSFGVKHLVISTVRGEFGKTSGTVNLDEKDLTKSSVEAIIDTTTIDTRVADRDKHLKSPDFFDVEKYPTITFKSTKIQRVGKSKLKVVGDLTMHGVTRPVTLDVVGPTDAIVDPMGATRRAVSASTKINRKDFGLNWSKAIEAGPVVGDMVEVQLDLEMVKAEPAKQAQK